MPTDIKMRLDFVTKDAVEKATGTLTIDGLKVALDALIHQAIKGQLGR